MTHYHISRRHAPSVCYGEWTDALGNIVAELADGLRSVAEDGNQYKMSEISDLIGHFANLDRWADEEDIHREMGDRSWAIRPCEDYDCAVQGGSW